MSAQSAQQAGSAGKRTTVILPIGTDGPEHA